MSSETQPFSLAAAAAEAPEETAVVRAGVALSFGHLLEDVRQAASRLKRWQRPQGEGIAFVARPSYERFVTLHAAIALGLKAALLHPGWPARLRLEMAARSGTRVLTGRTLRAVTPATDLDPPPPDDRRPLVLVATSGTGGGRPRWAVLSRAALAAAVAMSAQRLGWQDGDRWLLSLPLAHVGGLSIVLRALAARRAVVLAPLDWSRPAGVLDVMRRDRVTLVSVVPTQLDRLLTVAGHAPPTLRAVLVGGAAASPELLEGARHRGWPVLATYGSTETCSQIATQRPDEETPDEGCGPPLSGLALRIETDGVIAVRGDSLMTGYWPLGGPQPFTEDGWLPTGDRGRLDEAGHLHVLGRADDVIVSGGENVDPLAVETALTAHPGIAEALVFGVSDPAWGKTVAALLIATGQPLDDQALLAHLNERLAGFARPRWIAWIDALPRTPMGKPDRQAAGLLADRLRPLDRPLDRPPIR